MRSFDHIDTLADASVIEKVYPIAIEAAKYMFRCWPGLLAKVECVEDVVDEWILCKSRYLPVQGKDYEKPSYLRACVFWGIKRYVKQYMYSSPQEQRLEMTPFSVVSLNDDMGHTPLIEFVTYDGDREGEYPEDIVVMEELMASLESETFGSGDVVHTPDGDMDMNLRTVAELLLQGHSKKAIAEMCDVTPAYITQLTRGRMAEVLEVTV